MKTGNTFLDRLIDRLDRVDPANLQTYVLRLLREKGFFETVFNTIKEGVVVVDGNLKIQYTNNASRSLLGIRDDFFGQRIDRFLRDLDWRRLMNADAEQWHRVSLQEIEVFYPVHRFLSFYLVPFRHEETESAIPMAILILHDVTERHQDTQKHVESQKVQAITMLAAGVAHEIGNPLNSLTIHLQLLGRRLERSTDPELAREARELLDVATQEVSRLDGIINNFLRAIRPVEPQLEPLNLKTLLTELLHFVGQEIADRNILVEATWPDQLPTVLGDAGQLKQAFYNIIRN
ncbi:MAG: PAS domain-containing protein, partial [Rhodanobacteraceae bacterium]|nr:PAS domain-containing protein [Rhodanobacteraceae bacterium]